ncbi:hypothetical protein HU200_066741 [Digitaria exilis]|uniref:Pectinesterase inhibitor domain-containing protein n=1 Tax=Digitaria exilis TaxID=1010633 RepID=A0A834ZXN8_9POAL|nr:hypothetical protein HU200_066741 [Digitaria exilis]CAB3475668.1 unnamed protein product [Digitaria exilis]
MAPLTSITLFAVAAAAAATLTSSLLTNAAALSPPWLAIPPPPPPPPCVAPASAVAFLRARCATTLYGVACYDTLIPYACTFHTSHVKLARAATDVNSAWLRGLSKRVKELVAARGGSGAAGAAAAEAAALRDCAGTVSSAAGLAKQTAAELAKLDGAGATAGRKQIRWSVSNAQTWLSASMTNEATCTDGIGVAASLAAREVVIGVVRAKESTNIALALVNGIPVPP